MKLLGNGSRIKNSEGKTLNRIVMQHLSAWVILLFVGAVIWQMASPVIPNQQAFYAGQESEATVTAIGQTPAASTETASAIGSTKKAQATKAAVKGTTITTVAGPKTTSKTAPAKGRVRIIVEALNIRVAPDITSQVIDSIGMGETVNVIGTSGNWLKVRTDTAVEGYISASMAEPVK
ncbi:MAG TPA: SH3 domain-containing protein [Candidatus Aquicultor sp.]